MMHKVIDAVTIKLDVTLKVISLQVLLVACAFGQGLPADVDGHDAQRAKTLLNKALSYYQEAGDASLAAISRQGQFTDDGLYVYVVNTEGTMLASGGPSATLIGRDVSQALGESLRAEFRQALDRPETGEIYHATYRWQNWSSGRYEKKSVFYTRVDDKVFAVGYYVPRSNEKQAKELLNRVVQSINESPEETIEKINGLSPEFLQDDLYAFIIDRNSERFVAHGYNRRLVGSDFNKLRSTDKKPIGKSILKMAESKNSGKISYLWPNPTTNSNEPKITLFRVTGKYIVAVGYYLNADDQ